MPELILCAEEERFVLENGWDTAIPFSFTDVKGEGLTLSVFPQAEHVARAFLSGYAENSTSDAALSFLFREMAPLLRQWGYRDDRFRDRWGYILRAAPPYRGSLAPARRLTAADEAINKTTYDLAETCRAGCLAFGVEDGGRVVSLAVTHEAPAEGQTLAEVGVETIPAARRRGYAAASLSALTAALTARGMTVEYRCQRYNHASRRTALAAGFCEVGKYYYYVGRRTETHGI